MGDVAGALSKLQPQHQQLGAEGARLGGASGSASKKKLGAVKDPVAERRKAKVWKEKKGFAGSGKDGLHESCQTSFLTIA